VLSSPAIGNALRPGYYAVVPSGAWSAGTPELELSERPGPGLGNASIFRPDVAVPTGRAASTASRSEPGSDADPSDAPRA